MLVKAGILVAAAAVGATVGYVAGGHLDRWITGAGHR